MCIRNAWYRVHFLLVKFGLDEISGCLALISCMWLPALLLHCDCAQLQVQRSTSRAWKYMWKHSAICTHVDGTCMTAAVVSRLCRRWRIRSRVPTKKHSKCLQARTSGGIAASVKCDGSLINSHLQAVAEQMWRKAKDAVELVMPGCHIQRQVQQGVQLVSQRHACQHQHTGRISSCCGGHL